MSLIKVCSGSKSHDLQFSNHRWFSKYFEQAARTVRQEQRHSAILHKLENIFHDGTRNISQCSMLFESALKSATTGICPVYRTARIHSQSAPRPRGCH